MSYLTVLAGFGVMAAIFFALFYLLLNTIANWKLLSKAGIGGWQSLVPVWNTVARYGVSWSKLMGIIVVILGIIVASYTGDAQNEQVVNGTITTIGTIASIIAVIEKFKLSKVYGHGILFALGLVLCEPLFIMILAFGSSRYQGKK